MKRKRLSLKMVLFCIVFAIVLSIIIGVIGYYTFSDSIEKRYENFVAATLNVSRFNIDADDMQNCIESNQMTEKYNETQVALNGIKENAGVQYIYLVYFDDHSDLRYVMNAYTEYELREESDTISHLNDKAGELDFDESLTVDFQNMFNHPEQMNTIEYVKNRTDVDEAYGGDEYVMTGYRAIKNKEGDSVAILAVDIPIDEIHNTLRSYLRTVAIGTMVVLLIFIAIVLFVINRGIVKPITQMAFTTNEFVKQSHIVKNPSEFEVKEVIVKTKDEIQDLAESINHMTHEIVTYMTDMSQLTAKEEKRLAEIDIINQIKSNLLPSPNLDFSQRNDLSIVSSITIAKEAKGNFYQYFLIDSAHLCIFIGDVSESGIPTTIFSVIASTHIQNYAKLGYDVDRILFEANNQLSQNNELNLNVRVFLGIVDLINGDLSYASAGQMDVLLKKSGCDFEKLELKKSFELGMMENVYFSKSHLKMSQGEMLCLYSEGFVKMKDIHGVEFSDDSFIESMNTILTKNYELEDMVKQLNSIADQYTDNKAQDLDRSLILFRYL